VDALQAVAVGAAGVCAGLINTVVGSGTLITFPVLLAVGYPPITANVSNGLGLVPGSLTGALGYRAELKGQTPRVTRLAIASVVGGVGGAILLLNLPAGAFATIVPVLIAISLVLVVAQPFLAKRLAARAEANPKSDNHVGVGLWLGILLTGVYGGYFGAAQGVITLGLMGLLLNERLQRVNAIKNVLTALANLASGIVFIFIAHIAWLVVVLIAVGSSIGGLIGARIGRKLPPMALRGVIVVVGLVAIAKLVIS
jgi:uncharacterized membrane protein YfcA